MSMLKMDGVCSVDPRRIKKHVRIVTTLSPKRTCPKPIDAWASKDDNEERVDVCQWEAQGEYHFQQLSKSLTEMQLRVNAHRDFRTVYGTGATQIRTTRRKRHIKQQIHRFAVSRLATRNFLPGKDC